MSSMILWTSPSTLSKLAMSATTFSDNALKSETRVQIANSASHGWAVWDGPHACNKGN